MLSETVQLKRLLKIIPTCYISNIAMTVTIKDANLKQPIKAC